MTMAVFDASARYAPDATPPAGIFDRWVRREITTDEALKMCESGSKLTGEYLDLRIFLWRRTEYADKSMETPDTDEIASLERGWAEYGKLEKLLPELAHEEALRALEEPQRAAKERAILEELAVARTKSQKGRSRGGSGKTPALGIVAICKQELLRTGGNVTNNQVWDSIPETETDPRDIATGDRTYEVYRSGDELVQIDERGKTRSITRGTFENYMTGARKKSRPQRPAASD